MATPRLNVTENPHVAIEILREDIEVEFAFKSCNNQITACKATLNKVLEDLDKLVVPTPNITIIKFGIAAAALVAGVAFFISLITELNTHSWGVALTREFFGYALTASLAIAYHYYCKDMNEHTLSLNHWIQNFTKLPVAKTQEDLDASIRALENVKDALELCTTLKLTGGRFKFNNINIVDNLNLSVAWLKQQKNGTPNSIRHGIDVANANVTHAARCMQHMQFLHNQQNDGVPPAEEVTEPQQFTARR